MGKWKIEWKLLGFRVEGVRVSVLRGFRVKEGSGIKVHTSCRLQGLGHMEGLRCMAYKV